MTDTPTAGALPAGHLPGAVSLPEAQVAGAVLDGPGTSGARRLVADAAS